MRLLVVLEFSSRVALPTRTRSGVVRVKVLLETMAEPEVLPRSPSWLPPRKLMVPTTSWLTNAGTVLPLFWSRSAALLRLIGVVLPQRLLFWLAPSLARIRLAPAWRMIRLL